MTQSVQFVSSESKPLDIVTDCLVLGLYENQALSELAEFDERINQFRDTQLIEKAFTGEFQQTFMIMPQMLGEPKSILLVGLGQAKDLNSSRFCQVLDVTFKKLSSYGVSDIACFLSGIEVPQTDVNWRVTMLVRSALYCNYKFEQFKSKKTAAKKCLAKITLPESNQVQLAIDKGIAIAEGINFARELGNMPANICTPAYLAKQALTLTQDFPELSVNVLEKSDLQQLKMHAFLAVGQGSHASPRLIELHYQGGNPNDQPVVLVGKGVTFDSGGISLKPAANMQAMKFDMSGAGSVLGAIRSIVQLKLPINVIGLVAAAENMPDGNSYRPGDILTTMSGKTIEVVNTDAEGRLLLCDTLTYAAKFNPKTVINVATLTGAMLMALGPLFNGVISNNDALASQLVKAGNRSNDRVWHMPLVEEYQEALKSNYADMINASRLAGALTAGCFLARFTEEYCWAHIDCAGTAIPFDESNDQGATGRPVPLLIEYLMHASQD